MKYFLAFIFTFGVLNESSSQNLDSLERVKLTRVWGEISDYSPEHRGKAGLILLQLKSDNSFLAYETSDYGASILQVGKWKLKGNNITFEVNKTILARPEKQYAMKGRILEPEKGEITYQVLALDESLFVIKDVNADKTLKFKQSKYIYFPKDVIL